MILLGSVNRFSAVQDTYHRDGWWPWWGCWAWRWRTWCEHAWASRSRKWWCQCRRRDGVATSWRPCNTTTARYRGRRHRGDCTHQRPTWHQWRPQRRRRVICMAAAQGSTGMRRHRERCCQRSTMVTYSRIYQAARCPRGSAASTPWALAYSARPYSRWWHHLWHTLGLGPWLSCDSSKDLVK